jgi:uncharacterized protein Yka (UPF0111/DUF47 family)
MAEGGVRVRLDRWLRHLLPKEDRFLSLFERDAENLAQGSAVLRRLFECQDPLERDGLIRRMEEIEHAGDEITHEIFHELSSTFITHLDRQDIGVLASALDDILDHMDRAATRLELFHIRSCPKYLGDLATIIDHSVQELRVAIPLLQDLRDIARIKEAYVRINAYENQADLIFHRALEQLFLDETDPIALIKTREILEVLETAVDKCEDAAVLLENVLVKHA